MRNWVAISGLISLALLSGCGSVVTRPLNIAGRVIFTDGVAAIPGARLVVEASVDEFATVAVKKSFNNDQGFLAVPFEIEDFSVPGDAAFLMVRAFQDTSGNGTWEAGEGTGRYDRTQTGNSSFSLIILEKVGELSASTMFAPATTVSEIDIRLDATGAR